jgi:hypothetical protein
MGAKNARNEPFFSHTLGPLGEHSASSLIRETFSEKERQCLLEISQLLEKP